MPSMRAIQAGFISRCKAELFVSVETPSVTNTCFSESISGCECGSKRVAGSHILSSASEVRMDFMKAQTRSQSVDVK